MKQQSLLGDVQPRKTHKLPAADILQDQLLQLRYKISVDRLIIHALATTMGHDQGTNEVGIRPHTT
jgi:hypothetical protein